MDVLDSTGVGMRHVEVSLEAPYELARVVRLFRGRPELWLETVIAMACGQTYPYAVVVGPPRFIDHGAVAVEVSWRQRATGGSFSSFTGRVHVSPRGSLSLVTLMGSVEGGTSSNDVNDLGAILRWVVRSAASA
ncbi:MAG: hypothetical protein HKL87_02620 [Acidimicrobiaceae bacterium]|nr:hypothetical protein [Acidimicrobiaceae bacterium]